MAVVNAVMNVRVPLVAGLPGVHEDLLASEGLCCMEFGRSRLLANLLVLWRWNLCGCPSVSVGSHLTQLSWLITRS